MNSNRSIKHREKTGQEGFAIIEALIATMIFAIGVFGVLSMQTNSVRANDLARGVTSQSAMAAEKVEQLISLPYGHVDLEDGVHPPEVQGSYTINWTVAQDDMIANTKTITAAVSWIERGVQKTINLVYIKSDTI